MSTFAHDFASSLTSIDHAGRAIVRTNDPQHGDRVVAFSAGEVDEGRYVNPESKDLFETCSCVRYIPVFGPAVECYGYKLVASLSFTYFLSKGLGFHLMKSMYQPMYDLRHHRLRMRALHGDDTTTEHLALSHRKQCSPTEANASSQTLHFHDPASHEDPGGGGTLTSDEKKEEKKKLAGNSGIY
eukprot:gene10936-7591_t